MMNSEDLLKKKNTHTQYDAMRNEVLWNFIAFLNIAWGRKKRFHIGQTFQQPEGQEGDLVIQRADSICKDRTDNGMESAVY